MPDFCDTHDLDNLITESKYFKGNEKQLYMKSRTFFYGLYYEWTYVKLNP